MDESFQEQTFLWERGASVGSYFKPFTFKTFYMHMNMQNMKDREKQVSFKTISQNMGEFLSEDKSISHSVVLCHLVQIW